MVSGTGSVRDEDGSKRSPVRFIPGRFSCGLPVHPSPRNELNGTGHPQADTAADRKDRDLLQSTLKPLADRLGYRLVMSLANYKYAGTAVLVRWVAGRALPRAGLPRQTRRRIPTSNRPRRTSDGFVLKWPKRSFLPFRVGVSRRASLSLDQTRPT